VSLYCPHQGKWIGAEPAAQSHQRHSCFSRCSDHTAFLGSSFAKRRLGTFFLPSPYSCSQQGCSGGYRRLGWSYLLRISYHPHHIRFSALFSSEDLLFDTRILWYFCLAHGILLNLLPGLACTYFFTFFGRIPKYGFGHETDRQKSYGRKNTGEFGVSAIRIQWTTSRTKILPKSRNEEVNFFFAYPNNPGILLILLDIVPL